MKICPNCSARNYDNAEVCFNCRTPLTNVPIYPDPVSQQQPGIVPYMQQSYFQNPNNMQFPGQIPMRNTVQQHSQDRKTKTKNTGKKNTLLIVFAIIAGLLLITNGVTLFFLLNSENMKYKEAYLTLQKTLVTENLQSAVSAALGRGDTNKRTGESQVSGDVPVTNLSGLSEPTATPEPKIEYLPLELKQKFDLQDVEIQLDSAQWGEEVKPSNTSGYYNYASNTDGEKYFYIWGTVKNNKGENIDLHYSLNIQYLFNDKFSYGTSIYGEEKDGTGIRNYETTIKPLEKKRFVIIASVPDEVKEIFDHCVVTIGFNDDFSNVRYDDFEEMDKVYQLYVR